MTGAERVWLWSQPLVAVLAAIGGVAAWVLQLIGDVSALPTLQALVTGSFVLPGLAISLTVNHLAVMKRRPPRLTVGEKLLLIVEYVLVVAILAISVSPDLLFLGYLLWPLLVATAALACWTMIVNTLRSRREPPAESHEHEPELSTVG